MHNGIATDHRKTEPLPIPAKGRQTIESRELARVNVDVTVFLKDAIPGEAKYTVGIVEYSAWNKQIFPPHIWTHLG